MMDSAFNPILRQSKHNEPPKAAEVAELRQKLLTLNVWPEAGDEFLALLPVSRWHSPPPTDEDNEWLLLVARDALKGIDIGAYYPAFFQKLITNHHLRQAFLHELELHHHSGHSPPMNGMLKQ